MKKLLLAGMLFFAVACNSGSETSAGADTSNTENNGVTNSPPGGSSDNTNAGIDTSFSDTSGINKDTGSSRQP